jgi:2'-5' RNA ligase
MMDETLEQMVLRTRRFQNDSVPHEQTLSIAPGVREKVEAESGRFLPFFGSTIIYFLDTECRRQLQEVITQLHAVHRENLSTPLPSDSLHVTLHDLRSSQNLGEITNDMNQEHLGALHLVAEAKKVGSIEMSITTVFNLVNTSIVVGLLPTTQADCEKLLNARGIFDALVPSTYFYTPHITLAYYRPEAPDPISPLALRDTLDTLTTRIQGKQVFLRPDNLELSYFSAMDTYSANQPVFFS